MLADIIGRIRALPLAESTDPSALSYRLICMLPWMSQEDVRIRWAQANKQGAGGSCPHYTYHAHLAGDAFESLVGGKITNPARLLRELTYLVAAVPPVSPLFPPQIGPQLPPLRALIGRACTRLTTPSTVAVELHKIAEPNRLHKPAARTEEFLIGTILCMVRGPRHYAVPLLSPTNYARFGEMLAPTLDGPADAPMWLAPGSNAVSLTTMTGQMRAAGRQFGARVSLILALEVLQEFYEVGQQFGYVDWTLLNASNLAVWWEPGSQELSWRLTDYAGIVLGPADTDLGHFPHLLGHPAAKLNVRAVRSRLSEPRAATTASTGTLFSRGFANIMETLIGATETYGGPMGSVDSEMWPYLRELYGHTRCGDSVTDKLRDHRLLLGLVRQSWLLDGSQAAARVQRYVGGGAGADDLGIVQFPGEEELVVSMSGGTTPPYIGRFPGRLVMAMSGVHQTLATFLRQIAVAVDLARHCQTLTQVVRQLIRSALGRGCGVAPALEFDPNRVYLQWDPSGQNPVPHVVQISKGPPPYCVRKHGCHRLSDETRATRVPRDQGVEAHRLCVELAAVAAEILFHLDWRLAPRIREWGVAAPPAVDTLAHNIAELDGQVRKLQAGVDRWLYKTQGSPGMVFSPVYVQRLLTTMYKATGVFN